MDILPKPTPYPERFQYARRMIFLGIVFVPFAAFALALGVSGLFFANTLGSSAHEALRRVVDEHARDVEAYLEERQHDLDFALNAYPAEELSQPETLDSLLVFLNGKSDVFESLALVDAKAGLVIAARSRNAGEGRCEIAPWPGAVLPQDNTVSDVFSDGEGRPRVVVSRKSASGEAVLLCATINAEAFLDVVVAGQRDGGEVFLLDRTGRIMALSGAGGPSDVDNVPDLGSHAGYGGKAVSFVHDGDGGSKYLIAIARLKEGGLALATRQRFGDAFNDLFQTGWYVLAISLLGGMVTLSLAAAVSRRIGDALKDAEEVREVLRERLSRSVRLAELGEMAAGFAHEINNPLQVMESEITIMDLVLKDYGEAGEKDSEGLARDLTDSLDELQLQIQRCSRVTKSILAFGRQESLDDETFDLAGVMRDVAGMVTKKSEIRSIDLRTEIASEALATSGDAGKLRQVFLNLLNNAVYAVAEKFGGRSGGCIDFTARPHSPGWILVEVRDNGAGIPKEVLNNIYTPFFTTKPPQKGTGLGLSVCYGLVESMGGAIDVETRRGEGTVFRITLPSV
jgi:two-component system NtrC family sensor kinase